MSHRANLLVLVFLLLATMAPACLAAHYTLANGDFDFSVPDGWSRILESPGDPEMQVFKAPHASAANHKALARISVTSQSVPDIASFQSFIAEENERAQALPHYHLDKQHSTATSFHYTATDGAVDQTYMVRYYLHNGYAIQIRCVRPTRNKAGGHWAEDFKRSCKSVADSLH